MPPFDAATRAKLKAYIRGEVTWAEVEGLTFERARGIAQLGCDLAAASRLEEARVIFAGLLALNPRDAAVAAALGTVLQKLGRFEEARAAYSAALATDAQNPVALANRGELRLQTGDPGGAADLAAAVRADPNASTAAVKRARRILTATAARRAPPTGPGSAGASAP